MCKMTTYLYKVFIIACTLLFVLGNSTNAHSNSNLPLDCNDQFLEKAVVEVKTGIFIASLYDLNFTEDSYHIVFWMWWKYENKHDAPCELSENDTPLYVPFKFIEIINKQAFEIETSYQKVHPDGSLYVMAKFDARVNQKWDFSEFPFDTQKIVMELESVKFDSSQLNFKVDDRADDIIISSDVQFSDWSYQKKLLLEPYNKKYDSTFGEGTPGIYPRLKMTAALSRDLSGEVFFDIYLGFFLAFFMCLVLYFLPIDDLVDRIGIIFAAIISSVGQKQILQYSFPNSINSDLSNLIQITTFSFIFITLVCSIVCGKYVKTDEPGNIAIAKRIHWSVFMIVTVAYLLFVGFGVYRQ